MIADGFKEFGLRAIDGSKTTVKAYKDIGLNADKILELGYEDSERKAYLEKHKINFPMGHLSPAAQAAYGGVQLFPTLFLVDKDGVIRAHFVNYKDEATLQQAIEKVL